MKKTILISGIKGFLGSNLVTFLKADYAIFGIGRKTEVYNDTIVFSSDELEKIDSNPDFVIICHAAVSSGKTVQSNKLLFEVNVEITEQLLQKFSTSKIIYISSVSLYDISNNLIKEDSAVNPQSNYAVSKRWAELLVFENSNAITIRFSSLFGIGMKENTIIPNYVNQALNNGVIEVFGKGERKQNYIHIYDACNYIKSAIANFESVKEKILLGVSKKEYSNQELAQIISEITTSKIRYINGDDSKSFHYNNDFTCKLLGYEPKERFREAISNYVKWKKELS